MKEFIVFFLMTLSVSSTASAWDGTVKGKIKYFDVTSGDNLGFRITLENTPALCGNTHTWAYVRESDSNYKTVVSSLMAAKFADREVIIFTNIDSRTYCHIGYIRVN